MRVKSGGSSRFVAGALGEGLTIYEMEGVAGISRPRRRLFPGGRVKQARSPLANLPMEYAPLCREVKGR